MNMLKRILSIAMTALMLLSILTVVPASAGAISDGSITLDDGSSYLCKKGDVVEYKAYLKADEYIEDFQSVLRYDPAILKLNRVSDNFEEEGPVYCPSVEDAMVNAGIDGEVWFSAINFVNGFDFTASKEYLVLEFEYIGTGDTALNLVTEEMTIKGGDRSYFTESKPEITEGISFSYSLTGNTGYVCEHTQSDDWVIETEPSTESAGVLARHCTQCGEITETKELPVLKISGASLTLQSSLEINYKVAKTLIDGGVYENPYIVFKLGDVEEKVTEYYPVGNYYVFDFSNISPDMMNDTITATLYANVCGVELSSETIDYSVAKYCYTVLERYTEEAYSSLRTLIVDLLKYGEKTQVYTGHNVENLVSAKLTPEQLACGTQGDPELETVFMKDYKTVENPKATWNGAGLNLMDSICLRFKLTASDISGLSVHVENSVGESIIEASAFEEIEAGSYYVYFDELDASQLSETIYITAYEGNTPVSDTLRFSVESYAYSAQNSADTALAELVKAMMNYGSSAKAYVG